MAVHAYLHRKEGSASNADYWYERSGRSFYRPTLDAERTALIEGLLAEDREHLAGYKVCDERFVPVPGLAELTCREWIWFF